VAITGCLRDTFFGVADQNIYQRVSMNH
jgi:hypothetical protein